MKFIILNQNNAHAADKDKNMHILKQHDRKCTIFYKIWQPCIKKMAAIFDKINPDQGYVSLSMLNGFVDP